LILYLIENEKDINALERQFVKALQFKQPVSGGKFVKDK
jgi:hypothetical protein